MTTTTPLERYVQEGTFLLHQTGSPKKLQTMSVLSQSSRLVSLQNKTTESPATSPCSHHAATEREEEFTPFWAAASSNGALPTPSCFSKERSHSLPQVLAGGTHPRDLRRLKLRGQILLKGVKRKYAVSRHSVRFLPLGILECSVLFRASSKQSGLTMSWRLQKT